MYVLRLKVTPKLEIEKASPLKLIRSAAFFYQNFINHFQAHECYCLHLYFFFPPMSGLCQLIAGKSLRRSKEERLAVGVYRHSSFITRQGLRSKSNIATCNIRAGRKRNVLRVVERYDRQLVKLQGFWAGVPHNVSFNW